LKVGDILTQEEVFSLREQGADNNYIKSYAKQRLQEQKTAEEKSNLTKSNFKILDDFAGGDSAGAKLGRGVIEASNRTYSLLNFADNKLGLDLIDDRKIKDTADWLEKQKEQTSQKGLSKERLAQIEQLKQESSDAKGVWENVKAGAKGLVDVVTHPSEWTMQGIVAGTLDPLNALSIGAGGIAGRVVAKMGKGKVASVGAGIGAGALEGATVNSAGEYAIARGQGKNEDEAKKIAIQSATGGAMIGGAFGGAGGYAGHTEAINNISTSPKDDLESFKSNPLFDIEEEIQQKVNLGEQLTSEEAKKVASVLDEYKKEQIDPNKHQKYEPDFRINYDNLPSVLGSKIREVIDPEIVEQVQDVAQQELKAIELKHGNKLEHKDVIYADLKGWKESTGQHIVDAINGNRISALQKAEQESRSMYEQEMQTTYALKEQGYSETQIKDILSKQFLPTPQEAQLSSIINNNIDILPSYAGNRLRERLAFSIKNGSTPVEKVAQKMSDAGFVDEVIDVVATSYKNKNIDIFDEYVANKVTNSIEQEAIAVKELVDDSIDIDSIIEIKDGKIIDDVTKVREDVKYKVVKKDDIKPEFEAGKGYQFRSEQNLDVIDDIANNFDVDRHFESDGGFDGLPAISKDGKVLVGNHRSEAIKNLNAENMQKYKAKAKEKFGLDLKDDEMIVREFTTKDADNLKRIAKVSNDRRVSKESEKLILDSAKFEDKLKSLDGTLIEDEGSLKYLLGADDEIASNRAMLGSLSNDLPVAIDRFIKNNPKDLEFKQMFYKNAFRLHNLKVDKNSDSLDISSNLARSVNKMTLSTNNKNKNLSDVVKHYNDLIAIGGKDIEGNSISKDDFVSDIIGVGLKHYKGLKDNGIVEFGQRLEDIKVWADEVTQPSLFGEAQEIDKIDTAMQFLSNNDRNNVDLQNIIREIRRMDGSPYTKSLVDDMVVDVKKVMDNIEKEDLSDPLVQRAVHIAEQYDELNAKIDEISKSIKNTKLKVKNSKTKRGADKYKKILQEKRSELEDAKGALKAFEDEYVRDGKVVDTLFEC
jgi:hypothetical protein